jgi:ankyrin repeat protein
MSEFFLKSTCTRRARTDKIRSITCGFYNSNSTLVEAIDFSIGNGIDVDAKENYGRNALHLLCNSNSSPILTYAIQLKESVVKFARVMRTVFVSRFT